MDLWTGHTHERAHCMALLYRRVTLRPMPSRKTAPATLYTCPSLRILPLTYAMMHPSVQTEAKHEARQGGDGAGLCCGGGAGDRAPTRACPPHRSPPPTQVPRDAAHQEAFQDACIAGHRLAVDAPGRVVVWGSGAHPWIRTTAAPWGKAVPCREEVSWGGATPPRLGSRSPRSHVGACCSCCSWRRA